MEKDWKLELRDFFTKFDFSSAVLEKKDCKQFQFGGIKENKELFKKSKRFIQNILLKTRMFERNKFIYMGDWF